MESSGDDRARDAALDGIRGVAILLVLCVHNFRFQPDGAVWSVLNAICRSGWLGVDLFFVLSGFLITNILMRARGGQHYFRNFYARRTLRIFPAYYLFLAFVLVVLPQFSDTVRRADPASWAPTFLFYLQNLAIAWYGEWSPWRGVDHLWSLAIEEQFYLIWPLIVWLTPPARLGRVCLATIGVAWACKALLVAWDSWNFTIHLFTFARMDALASGAWVAAFVSRQSGRRRAPPVALCLAGAALFYLAGRFVLERGLSIGASALSLSLTTSAAAVGFAAILFVLADPANDVPRRLVSGRVLRFFGRYSYGLYLVHLPWHVLAAPWLIEVLTPQLPINWVVHHSFCNLV